jgi:hypothetical protein
MARIPRRVVLTCHQIKLVRLRIRRRALLDRFLFSRQQFQFERVDDRFRNFILQREDVVQVAIVALGPQMAVGRALDQLCRDAHAVARFAHAALENMRDIELAGDLSDIDSLRLERERRVARDDGERGHLAQIGDDVLGDAVAEIFLLRIAAHVDEREDADGKAPTALHRGGKRLLRRSNMQCEHMHGSLDILDRVLAEILIRAALCLLPDRAPCAIPRRRRVWRALAGAPRH